MNSYRFYAVGMAFDFYQVPVGRSWPEFQCHHWEPYMLNWRWGVKFILKVAAKIKLDLERASSESSSCGFCVFIKFAGGFPVQDLRDRLVLNQLSTLFESLAADHCDQI